MVVQMYDNTIMLKYQALALTSLPRHPELDSGSNLSRDPEMNPG